MIELEIQALALQREGLLIEVGRLAGGCGFTLQKQRLVQDPHGTLLSMVVRGPWLKKFALRRALGQCERLTSFILLPFREGEPREHFAASRRLDSGYVPPPAPEPEPMPEPPADAAPAAEPPRPVAAVAAAPLPPPPLELYDALVMRPSVPRPVEKVAEVEPYVEVEPLEPDAAAVEASLARLQADYPRILPPLLALDRAVPAGAREATLQLAGQRLGAWLHARDYAAQRGLGVPAALAAVALPALAAFAEVELQGEQLHIRASALCAEHGHSGCGFYHGLLEGLLGPAVAQRDLSVFPVCCRSFGAEACVLAISE